MSRSMYDAALAEAEQNVAASILDGNMSLLRKAMYVQELVDIKALMQYVH